MSLDVYLKSSVKEKEICHHCNSEYLTSNELFTANITHNLNDMAEAVGIYKHLWRPDEIGVTFAKELIESLTIALKELKNNPDVYKIYNPENGWGSYETFVHFVIEYLDACIKYPNSIIEVCR